MSVPHRVRNHGLLVDSDETALVFGDGLLLRQFVVAHVEEVVELVGVRQANNEILGIEHVPAELAVAMLNVDLVEQPTLDVGDVVAADASARVYVLMEIVEVLVEQLDLDHAHGAVLLPLPEDVRDVAVAELIPAEVSLPAGLVRGGGGRLLLGRGGSRRDGGGRVGGRRRLPPRHEPEDAQLVGVVRVRRVRGVRPLGGGLRG